MWGKGPNELGCRGFGKSHPISPSSGRGVNVEAFFNLKCLLGSWRCQLPHGHFKTQKASRLKKFGQLQKNQKRFHFFKALLGALARARA